MTRRAESAEADAAKYYGEMKLAHDKATLCDLRARNAEVMLEIFREQAAQLKAEIAALRGRSLWRVICDDLSAEA
jgi:hypothetical protein